MRLDKYLKVSRIIKRRTVANDACSGGRVSVNGKDVKPSYKLKVNDIVELRFSSTVIKFKVKELREFAKKEDVESMYEFIGE